MVNITPFIDEMAKVTRFDEALDRKVSALISYGEMSKEDRQRLIKAFWRYEHRFGRANHEGTRD